MYMKYVLKYKLGTYNVKLYLKLNTRENIYTYLRR